MALPLTHRINHIPVYVPAADDAWDQERIDREKGWIDGTVDIPEGQVVPWEDLEDHPIERYHSGNSRFDLSTVSDYLDLSKQPLKFVLRKLPLKQWDEMHGLQERGGYGTYGGAQGRLYAVKHGLDAIEGIEEWKDKRPPMGWSDSQIESLRDMIGETQYVVLGYAIMQASRPLDPLEKKA